MKLSQVPTPSLVLDLAKLRRNARRMAAAAARHGVALRPHMKTAKSIDVARIVLDGQFGGIAVSTLKEAEYFAAHGIRDIQYAVCIVPDKLDRVAALQAGGVQMTVVTDNVDIARAIAERGSELGCRFRVLIEVDTGEHRSGVSADSDALLAIAHILSGASNAELAGVMTHAGHSYLARSTDEVERVAGAERSGVVRAAERLRAAGHVFDVVSMGSTPTALHAVDLSVVTEIRAGVYMFGDMFQAQIGSCAVDDLAVSVLAEIVGQRREFGRFLVDAGGLALSKDRSTQAVPNDVGFGLVAGIDGRPFLDQLVVGRVYQEHGEIALAGDLAMADMPIGDRVRIYPNHVCMTAAMYDGYHIVDSDEGDGQEVLAVWPRVNGW
jgi:D-serine deaminase-like pyridoxal phosphate-dependent protein